MLVCDVIGAGVTSPDEHGMTAIDRVLLPTGPRDPPELVDWLSMALSSSDDDAAAAGRRRASLSSSTSGSGLQQRRPEVT